MILVEEVQDWVSEVLSQPATLLELRSRMLERPVRSWTIPANDHGKADSGKIASEIHKAALRDGKTLSGPDVGYLVLALRAEGDSKWINSLSFDVPGKGARKPGDAGELESATQQGLTAQSMRQNENLHRMMLGSAEQREAGFLLQLAQKDAQIAKMQQKLDDAAGERMKIVLLSEELAKDELDREITRRRMTLDEKRHDYLGEKLENLVPILLNRLTGGGPGKGMPMMGEAALMRFLASLRPDQVDGAMSAIGLTEDQQALLGEIYMSYGQKAKQLEEAKKRKHAAPPTGGANGAPGPATPAKEGEPS